jgi:glutaredoxin
VISENLFFIRDFVIFELEYMECPYCKNEIDLKKLWKEKSFQDKFKTLFIYCFKIIEKPGLDKFSAPLLFLLIIAAILFLIVIVSISFIIYSDYKAGVEVLGQVGTFLLFLLILAVVFALILFAVYYHTSTEKIELLFDISRISAKCPHCKKEIQKTG